MTDEDVEANWLLELGNSLNVAGDLAVGAAGRLRAARTPAERAAARASCCPAIRRVLTAGGITLALLEREEEGSVEP